MYRTSTAALKQRVNGRNSHQATITIKTPIQTLRNVPFPCCPLFPFVFSVHWTKNLHTTIKRQTPKEEVFRREATSASANMAVKIFTLSKKTRLIVTIGISFSFFLLELICTSHLARHPRPHHSTPHSQRAPAYSHSEQLTPSLPSYSWLPDWFPGPYCRCFPLCSYPFPSMYQTEFQDSRSDHLTLSQLNDLIGFAVALAALLVGSAEHLLRKTDVPGHLTRTFPPASHRSRSEILRPRPFRSAGSEASSWAASSTAYSSWRWG